MRNARITEFFGDDEYDFRLGYGELLELQEKTGVGPFALYRRFMADDWYVSDIYETIRLGLVGGNVDGSMPPKTAFKLAKKYVQGEPPMTWLNLARAVLIVSLHGAPDEDSKPRERDNETAMDDDAGKLRSTEAYGMGAIMGYTPEQVDAMTLHQLQASFTGYSDHHSAANGGMTEKTKDDLFDMVLEEQARIDGKE